MISLCARSITAWLIRHEAAKEEERELYEYAVHSFILFLAPLVIVIVMGSFLGIIKESILFILPFMAIRKFSGGFHAKHEWVCLISSCAVLFLCVYVISNITYSIALGGVTVGAVISLMLLSPIDSENRRLSADEKKKYKRTTCIITGLFFGVFALLVFWANTPLLAGGMLGGRLKLERYACCIAVGLILSASLQLPCALQKLHFWQSV